MLDSIIYFLLKYIYVIAAVLFLIKILLFLKNNNKHWTVSQFLYFNPSNTQFTQNAERAKVKRIQNLLSIAIIIILLFKLLLSGCFNFSTNGAQDGEGYSYPAMLIH